jgi:mRNA-degrading endonuclease RelE of RelBE toxin-antitoxin system
VFRIEFAEAASKALGELRTYDRAAVGRAIFEQLSREPTTPTRNRKLLAGVTPPLDAVPPLWQLRVGEYRVFYDVNEVEKKVFVRAPRHKPPHKTTEDVL